MVATVCRSLRGQASHRSSWGSSQSFTKWDDFGFEAGAMAVDCWVDKIATHDTSESFDPQFAWPSLNVQAIIYDHESAATCTVHTVTSFESLLPSQSLILTNPLVCTTHAIIFLVHDGAVFQTLASVVYRSKGVKLTIKAG